MRYPTGAAILGIGRTTLIWQTLGFAAVSGTGLAVDVVLLMALVELGLSPAAANTLSAGTAVFLVYFLATYKVFRYAGRFLLSRFLIYVAYQVVAILAASFAVAFIAAAGLHVLAAKALILPITFSMNFLVLKYLTDTSP